ncbi:hypothetical protein LK07_20485 [Streptomyces pluripotens]|uniref:Uncharacterized protein n=2 Tax=Streptomyces TaxID=1883 RepID=A0A221P9B6_9ACTN|nr:hypothetical protein LK06_019320 [Streptomyces pluripotens]ASN28558.1 hypothetical protein LK07_20485 [Streptomyces pluripotens]KIE26523.1 membrane protein [Streptomyces sp. MUSC 125]
MWLRRQDELNEARPTERFSTAIRLLSGRAGMERRYAKDLRARSAREGEPDAGDPDAVTDSVDVRAFVVPPTRRQIRTDAASEASSGTGQVPGHVVPPTSRSTSAPPQHSSGSPVSASGSPGARKQGEPERSTPSARAAAARARRSKVLARRRRTTMMLFLAFTLGAIVAAVGGLAFLWAPAAPAALLSAYIAHLRSQERRRFAYQMDRRRAEAAAQRLRERERPPRRRAPLDADPGPDDSEEGPEAGADTGLSALAADRRALVEQTDHAEWVDQQRERQRRPDHGESWDPVPVPLPTYVTAPVAPRATSDVDLGAPGTWSSARSSALTPEHEAAQAPAGEPDTQPETGEDEQAPVSTDKPGGERSDARRAASARRARERGRTPLFDQYEDGDHPRAANE